MDDGNGNKVDLRTYIERIFDEHRVAHLAQHNASEKAIYEARTASEKAIEQARENISTRLDRLNELRQEVIEDRIEFVRKGTYDASEARIEERLSALEKWRAQSTGAALVLTLFAGAIGAAVVKAFGG